jgi:hypothetical protein
MVIRLLRATWLILPVGQELWLERAPWALLGTPGDSWALLGTPGDSWGLLGTPGHSWGVLGTPGESWAVLRTPGDSWGILGSPGESWGVLGTPGDPWGLLGSPGDCNIAQMDDFATFPWFYSKTVVRNPILERSGHFSSHL